MENPPQKNTQKAPWWRWQRGGEKNLKSFLAVVLLSASVERFFVSRMRDFEYVMCSIPCTLSNAMCKI